MNPYFMCILIANELKKNDHDRKNIWSPSRIIRSNLILNPLKRGRIGL